MKAHQFRQRKRFDQSHNVKASIIIPLQTVVMLYDELRATKNEPPYVGPHTISSQNENGTSKIKDEVGVKFQRSVVVDHLKILSHIIPLSSTNTDVSISGQWYVDHIVKRRFIKSLQTHQYLIRWVGFGPEMDEWVSANDIPDKSLIRECEFSKGLSRLARTQAPVLVQ